MSNELKEAAQQAVDAFDVFSDADDFVSLFALTQKMRALRTTIQQAEAQQPAQSVNEKHFGDFELLVVTTAYEQGFGHAFRTELSNPYAPATNAYKAWDMGRSAGKRNGQPQQPATAIACGIPGMVKTTCPYCEQGFAFEHEQPATPEPGVSRNPFASRCYTMSESHLSGHRLIVGFEKLVDAQDAHEWVARQGRGDFTHPAPSVPDGYVLVPIEPTVGMLIAGAESRISQEQPTREHAVWAAMLAAKKEKP